MSEMVDRVARAISIECGWGDDDNDRNLDGIVVWRTCLPEARAAIEAMREPTREMLNAAVDATDAGSGRSWANRSPQRLFKDGMAAMIDECLKEPTRK